MTLWHVILHIYGSDLVKQSSSEEKIWFGLHNIKYSDMNGQ